MNLLKMYYFKYLFYTIKNTAQSCNRVNNILGILYFHNTYTAVQTKNVCK